MKRDSGKNISELSMVELFQTEVEMQVAHLSQGLLAIEKQPEAKHHYEPLMRAAHSVKGAARMVGITPIERLAHALEDVFVAAQRGVLALVPEAVDVCLKSVDAISGWIQLNEDEVKHRAAQPDAEMESLRAALEVVLRGENVPLPAPTVTRAESRATSRAPTPDDADRVVRVSAERLTRILGMSSELMVEARGLEELSRTVLALKRRHMELSRDLDHLRDALANAQIDERTASYLVHARRIASDMREALAAHYTQSEEAEHLVVNATARLHREIILTRMRPFADGVRGFQRMVRDLCRATGKQVDLMIKGLRTEVDRDVLERMEAPLTHLLRNAIDHGIELPHERERAGKPGQGTIQLSAAYSAGMLMIVLEDDGRGVDFDVLRRVVVERDLTTTELAARMTQDELIEFLFLPKFSTREHVSDLSGRGVGLDVVRDVIQEMGGLIRTTTTPGAGMRFVMQLPITLSVLRALMVDIAQESYAFPLARVDRVLHVAADTVRTVEGRQYIEFEGHNVGLVSSAQVFGAEERYPETGRLAVVVVSDRLSRYGVVVDRIVGERVLAVQPLDPRIGKVKDISAAALNEDGTPTLIIDVDDFVRSIDHISRSGGVKNIARLTERRAVAAKRVLVVDDSLTVRAVEEKLLLSRGYHVMTAVDGMDGWNQVRSAPFDLVITDVDMPRMDGLELVRLIKREPRLSKLPVMIVSYKDRSEDRQRGLDAGADYYLTKGSFHDETLVQAVADLIGEARSE